MTNKRISRLMIALSIVVMTVMLSPSVFACPSCYGAAQNNTMDAVNNAVLTLLGITGFVLSGVVIFFVYVWKRSRRNHKLISNTTFVDNNGIIHMNNKGEFEWNIS